MVVNREELQAHQYTAIITKEHRRTVGVSVMNCSGNALIVQKVSANGAAADWNLASFDGVIIEGGDRIDSVNGILGVNKRDALAELRDRDKLEILFTKPATNWIHSTGNHGLEFGDNLLLQAPTLPIYRIGMGGIRIWNENNATKIVSENDHIIQVGDVNESAQKMKHALMHAADCDMLIRRYS